MPLAYNYDVSIRLIKTEKTQWKTSYALNVAIKLLGVRIKNSVPTHAEMHLTINRIKPLQI